MKQEVLLEAEHVSKFFPVGKRQELRAVEDVSLRICPGETLGLVGESGCGKSTLGRTLIRLYPPTGGIIRYRGREIHGKLTKEEGQNLHQKMQMIFQDPYASLNPRRKILDIIAEGMDAHHLYKDPEEREEKVLRLLERVGLRREHSGRFPHEFSEGQRQRVGIARALAVDPEFIVCDEPISALDVSIQAQVVNLLEELQEERGLSYLFIAHDLSMVKHISRRIGVMYLGSLVELTGSEELFENPLHPYTKALLSAIPIPDPEIEKTRSRIMLHGTIPSPIGLKLRCKFYSRCREHGKECGEGMPKLQEVSEGHFVACKNYEV